MNNLRNSMISFQINLLILNWAAYCAVSTQYLRILWVCRKHRASNALCFQNIDNCNQSDDRIILLNAIFAPFVMIQKKIVTPSLFSKFQKGLKVAIAAEIAAFLGSYCVWLRMNRDQGKLWNTSSFNDVDHLFGCCAETRWTFVV